MERNDAHYQHLFGDVINQPIVSTQALADELTVEDNTMDTFCFDQMLDVLFDHDKAEMFSINWWVVNR